MKDLRHYSRDEIVHILEKAKQLGYPLDKGSYLENLTIGQLDELVNQGKHDADYASRRHIMKVAMGDRRGNLLVLKRVSRPASSKTKHRQAWFECECSCGKTVVKHSEYLSLSSNPSCGCASKRPKKAAGPKKPESIRRRMMRTFCTRRLYASKNGIEFNLIFEDLPAIPTLCPILGIPVRFSDLHNDPRSLSLDRMIPSMGYVPGNVYWISNRANTLKTNAISSELRAIADWMDRWADAWCEKFSLLKTA